MEQDKLTKILTQFGKKWTDTEWLSWDIEYSKKRQKQLIKWAIKKIFYEH